MLPDGKTVSGPVDIFPHKIDMDHHYYFCCYIIMTILHHKHNIWVNN